MLKFSKQAQTGRKPKVKNVKSAEADLQKFTNDLLLWRNLKNIRIPDGFFRWVKMKAPAGIQIAFFKIFGGIPDNIIYAPVSDKYCLMLNLELKTKTQLHGKQIKNAKAGAWQIARTPEEVTKIIDGFEKDVEIIKKRGIEQRGAK